MYQQHYDVPADNNGSGRAIRNVKVRQKVSGQFKSSKGAHRFVVLRSVIDSAIKQNKNVFDVLLDLARFISEWLR